MHARRVMICFEVSGVIMWKRVNKRRQSSIKAECVWIDLTDTKEENSSPIQVISNFKILPSKELCAVINFVLKFSCFYGLLRYICWICETDKKVGHWFDKQGQILLNKVVALFLLKCGLA